MTRKFRFCRLLLILIVPLVCSCRDTVEASSAAATMPDFELDTLAGGIVRAADFDDRVLLVEFWATWCTPCRAQAKILEALHDEYPEEQVDFLAISVGEEAGIVRSFVEKSPFPYPVAVDPADRLSQELMIYALPTVMVVDREGTVVYFEVGISRGDTLRKVLDQALTTQVG